MSGVAPPGDSCAELIAPILIIAKLIEGGASRRE
jgi:hypothetical protein